MPSVADLTKDNTKDVILMLLPVGHSCWLIEGGGRAFDAIRVWKFVPTHFLCSISNASYMF